MSDEYDMLEDATEEEPTHCPKCGEVWGTLDHELFWVKRVIGRTAYPELHCTKEPHD